MIEPERVRAWEIASGSIVDRPGLPSPDAVARIVANVVAS